MQSKKLWQALAVIVLFSGVELFILSVLTWFPIVNAVAALVIGGVLMLASIVLSFLREKLPKIAPLTVGLNAAACGFFVAAFVIHKSLTDFLALILCTCLPIVAFCLLMAVYSLPHALRDKRLFLGITFLLWAVGSYFLGVWVLGLVCPQITDDYRLAYLLFVLPVVGLALGCLFPSETVSELLVQMLTPCTVTVGLVGVIVLLVVAGGDGCDCDCGDCGSDCCDCSTDYSGGNKKTRKMSELSDRTEFD